MHVALKKKTLHLLEIFLVTLNSLEARAFTGNLTVFILAPFSLSIFIMGRFFALTSGGSERTPFSGQGYELPHMGVGFATGKESPEY